MATTLISTRPPPVGHSEFFIGGSAPMKIHCAQLVEGALKSALSPNEDTSPADAESAPSLVDSLQQVDRKPVGGKLRLLKKKD